MILSLWQSSYKKYGITKLGDYADEEQSTLIKKYFKFIFVRNPFDRLLSAYKDKIECGVDLRSTCNLQTSPNHRLAIGRAIYNANIRQDAILLKSGKSITFKEFLQVLIDKPVGNKHWMQYKNVVDFCDFEFDHIGKVETINDDAQYVMSKLLPGEDNASYNMYFPSSNGNGSRKSNYYQAINKSTLQTILNMYENDFDAFNYPKKLPHQ